MVRAQRKAQKGCLRAAVGWLMACCLLLHVALARWSFGEVHQRRQGQAAQEIFPHASVSRDSRMRSANALARLANPAAPGDRAAVTKKIDMSRVTCLAPRVVACSGDCLPPPPQYFLLTYLSLPGFRDKKLNYDGKSVGPVLSVLNGCGPIVQEHHKVSADTAARSFRVVCEGGVSLLLIAPSAEEKTKWMEGIEIMLIGGYKRKKETISDPLGLSAADQVLVRGQGFAWNMCHTCVIHVPCSRNPTHWGMCSAFREPICVLIMLSACHVQLCQALAY